MKWIMKKKIGFKKWLAKLFKEKTANLQIGKIARYRKIEKFIAFYVLPVGSIIIMALPLIYWKGLLCWTGILMDITILYAFYKAYLRDIPPVYVGMPVSPFWGRMEGEYLLEGKKLVVPWDKIDLEPIKVQRVTIEEKEGYFTFGGAPIKLNVDIFYRIDQNNIYLYQEVKDEVNEAIDGKAKEYLYGLIGLLDTDEVVARQSEIRSGILEELRLHPLSSKEKLLSLLKIRHDLLKKELSDVESDEDKTKLDVERRKDLKSKINQMESRQKLVKIELNNLYQQEWRKEIRDIQDKKDKGKSEDDDEIKKLLEAIKIAEETKETEDEDPAIIELKTNTRTRIKKREEKELSELEEDFAIRILGSRVYAFDIADKDAKDARSKRTTAKFQRDATLTEWDAIGLAMNLLKQKHPTLTDAELLKAILIKEDKIIEKINIFGIEGLQEILPQIVSIVSPLLSKIKDKEVSNNAG